MDQHVENPEHRAEDDRADLVPALEVIEAQPIATRAAAYGALHDALAHKLDSGPSALRA